MHRSFMFESVLHGDDHRNYLGSSLGAKKCSLKRLGFVSSTPLAFSVAKLQIVCAEKTSGQFLVT